MKPINKSSLIAPVLSLFGSMGTLLCCALPALMITIGAGAALAGLVANVPQLIWLSEHKLLMFTVAGGLIVVSGFLGWLNRNAPCPLDPQQAAACQKLRKISSVIYWISVVLYAIGFFFAFIAAKLIG